VTVHTDEVLQRENVRSPMTSEEQTYFDEQLNSLHQKLDALQFDQIWTSGRALTMDQALVFALEENTGKRRTFLAWRKEKLCGQTHNFSET
jgi:hypothetical protein